MDLPPAIGTRVIARSAVKVGAEVELVRQGVQFPRVPFLIREATVAEGRDERFAVDLVVATMADVAAKKVVKQVRMTTVGIARGDDVHADVHVEAILVRVREHVPQSVRHEVGAGVADVEREAGYASRTARERRSVVEDGANNGDIRCIYNILPDVLFGNVANLVDDQQKSDSRECIGTYHVMSEDLTGSLRLPGKRDAHRKRGRKRRQTHNG